MSSRVPASETAHIAFAGTATRQAAPIRWPIISQEISFPGYDPMGKDFSMILVLQLLILFIGAGGAVLTAYTLPESRFKWTVVSTFGLAGVAGFALTILTYEQLTLSEAASSIWGGLQSGWGYLTALIQRRWLQILIALTIGIAIGVFGPREYQKRKTHRWYSSYDIFQLADPGLTTDLTISEDEVQLITEAESKAIQEERKLLGMPIDCKGNKYR